MHVEWVDLLKTQNATYIAEVADGLGNIFEKNTGGNRTKPLIFTKHSESRPVSLDKKNHAPNLSA